MAESISVRENILIMTILTASPDLFNEFEQVLTDRVGSQRQDLAFQ